MNILYAFLLKMYFKHMFESGKYTKHLTLPKSYSKSLREPPLDKYQLRNKHGSGRSESEMC